MIKNRFFKNTMGLFAEVAVTKNYNTDVAVTDIETFGTNAAAGDIRAFFSDTNLPLAAGDTALAANKNRSFYYAWKTGDGTIKRSADIPCSTVKYNSVAYDAGTAQVGTLTLGGTIAAGQTVHVKIIETTGGNLPYPNFTYSVTIGGGGVNAAATALAAAINAEKSVNSPVVTAAAVNNVVTLTGVDKFRSFKVVSEVETTTAQPTDDSAIVFAVTAALEYPIGDITSVQELERYSALNAGAVEYTWNNTTKEDLGWPASNASAAINYGFVIVTSGREQNGVVRNYPHTAYIVIAVETADVATIVAL